MSRLPLSLALCAIAVTSAPAWSQKDPAAGFGAQRVGPIDVGLSTGNDGHVGVVELNGELYVSSRGPSQQPPHVVYVFNQQGQLLRQFNQDNATEFSSWGYRDGTTDGANLAFGFEDGIHVVNNNGQLVGTFNGQAITNPVVAATASLYVHRGVAFDAAGDGGAGSFWVGDFGSPIYEIDLSGNVLTTLNQPAAGPQWSVYGLAWDTQGSPSATDDTLWISSAPNDAEIRELDPRTGQWTGLSILRDQASSGQGGLDGVVGAFGAFSLASMDQGAADKVTVYRVDRDSQVQGETEAVLLSSVGAGPLTTESPKFIWNLPVSVAFAFDVSGNPALANAPGPLIFNVGPAPLPDFMIPGFDEIVALLSPAAGILLPSTMNTSPFALTIPPSLGPANEVRLQTVYADLNMRSNFLIATNQVRWERREVIVEARGLDSFNADTSSGFFSITNNGTDPITGITLDWVASSQPNQAGQEFDTDAAGMSNRFDAGNSTVGGCNGTYRNNSHVTTGLVFDGANTVIGTPCDPSSNCGWIGTNPGLDAGDYRTLRFRFTNFGAGKTFEFDVDTDGGGTGGDEMDGLVVTILRQSGANLGPAELRRVPGQDRAVLKF